MNETSNGLRIPENHKEQIGARAIYFDSYFDDSPALENNFKGQYVLRKEWQIRFGVDDFIQTKLNPYFEIDNLNSKFTSIAWTQERHSAVTEVEQNTPFDTNIREIEI